MNNVIAVLKWLWDCPLRTAVLLGGGTYFFLRELPWESPLSRKLGSISYAVIAAFAGYYWQSAKEREKEK